MEAYLEHLTLLFESVLFVSGKYVVCTKYFCPPGQYTLRPGRTFGFSIILSL